MKYKALATDYDGTLSQDGHIPASVLANLERIRAAGLKLILVTGRELRDLLVLVPQLRIFDRVIAENGAVLYRPETRDVLDLAKPPAPAFLKALAARGVRPLAQGRIIVSTEMPFETTLLEVIRNLGLELTLSFNKGSVMVLPSGVNKATGLKVALQELDLSAESVVGVGDAENDHLFLDTCGYGVAVANALPALKEHADWVTSLPAGDGVSELVDRLLRDDLPPAVPLSN
jgi:hydroxymethylpyrimidine pyrophosphatase-like HAD family hydrolase